MATVESYTSDHIDELVNNVFHRLSSSYTLVLDDDHKFIEMNDSAANNLTVPPNSAVAFPIGSIINGIQRGAGLTTLVAGSGVTLNNRNGLVSEGQYARFRLEKVGTDEWYVSGDLTT